MTAMRYLLAVLAMAMAGCTGPLLRPDEAQEVAALLATYRDAAATAADEQRRELATAQAAYDKEQTDVTRLGLALAMLLPQVAARDETRVQSLLAGVSAAGGDAASARYDLAQTLLAIVAARQRAQREDQRKLDQLARQVREEKHRNEELQQKIESLRAIDRDLRGKRRIP